MISATDWSTIAVIQELEQYASVGLRTQDNGKRSNPQTVTSMENQR